MNAQEIIQKAKELLPLTKSTDINGCTHFDCLLKKAFTVKDFLEETRTISKYVTWYVQEKGQTVPVYTDGEKIVFVFGINTNAIVNKAKASEINGQYRFSINI